MKNKQMLIMLDKVELSPNVADNASSVLYKVRRKIELLEDRIKSKLNSYLTNDQYSKMLSDSIISQRDCRYVIPIKSEHKKIWTVWY